MPAEIQGNPTAITLGEIWRNIHTDNGGVFTADITELDDLLHSFELGLFRATLSAYGDGSDGALNFISTGSTTVAGATLSSGVYTMTRDIYAAGQTLIPAATTIKTAGFRFFCAGNLQNNGTIQSNGNAAAANAAGAALSYSGTISNTTVGAAGAAGSTTTGSAGSSSGTNGLGGAGGAGGNNASGPNLGAAGGTVTAPVATVEGPYTAYLAQMVRCLGTTAFALCEGGAGGGGGGGDGTNLSGGGGGGGGIVMVAAKNITGTGTIEALGGAGGAANATGTPSGGGGGGGGCVIILSASCQPYAISTATSSLIGGNVVSVAGGAAGTAGAGGGVVGNAGAAGTLILIPA
jgi:hypothetical protein